MCLIDLVKGFGHERVSCCVYLDHVVCVWDVHAEVGTSTSVLIVSGFTYDPHEIGISNLNFGNLYVDM